MRIAEIEKRCAGQAWRPWPKVLTSSRAGSSIALREAPALVVIGIEAVEARRGARVRHREHRRDHDAGREPVGSARRRRSSSGRSTWRSVSERCASRIDSEALRSSRSSSPARDAREHGRVQQQVHERPRERGVEIRLRAEVDQHDVARDALLARRPGARRPPGRDLVEEVAAPRPRPRALARRSRRSAPRCPRARVARAACRSRARHEAPRRAHERLRGVEPVEERDQAVEVRGATPPPRRPSSRARADARGAARRRRPRSAPRRRARRAGARPRARAAPR